MVDVADMALKAGAAYTTEGNRVLYIMSAEELHKFFVAARHTVIGEMALNESQVTALWQQSGENVPKFVKLIEYFYGGGHV